MNAPTFEIVKITPKMAEQMLDGQKNIRPLRHGVVASYANEMAAGNWRMTAEAIAFNGARLLNGFHRLNACVKAGIPFTVLVVRGIAEDAIENMDSGLKRSIGDVIREEGHTRPDAVAATARLLVAWDKGVISASGTAMNSISRTEIIAYSKANYAAIEAAIRVADTLRNAVGGSTAAFAAVYTRLDRDVRDDRPAQ